MIVAGESSGELYGALLAERLRDRSPGVRILGVGGVRMAAAGVELVATIASSFGVTEAIRTLGTIRKTFAKVFEAFATFTPQVVVLIDYPDFNFRVAREARKRGIKVLYYVSPQVWAWRTGRIRTIGKIVDRMAVILPFEADLYHRHGIPCEFVGHPVLDEIGALMQEMGYAPGALGAPEVKADARRMLGLAPDRPVLTVMPGSRPHEVRRLLPLMAEVMQEMSARYPGYQFIIPIAPNLGTALFGAQRFPGACRLVQGESLKALLAADAALIASGTSTLQAGVIGVPMAVVYKLSPLTYLIGKRVVKVRHISLVNILLDTSVQEDSGLRIKELLQREASSDTIVQELSRIIDDAGYRDAMTAQLRAIRRLFLGRKASARVAEIMDSLVPQAGTQRFCRT